jgi:hypothetical protein
MAIQITGSWNLTGSFTSSLGFQGTASHAISASYAPAGNSFPYTGSALITGSLGVTGSVRIQSTTSDGENILITKNTSGGAVYSGRGNSVLYLGVDQTGQRDLITLGAQGGIQFFGFSNSPYTFFNNGATFKQPFVISSSLTITGSQVITGSLTVTGNIIGLSTYNFVSCSLAVSGAVSTERAITAQFLNVNGTSLTRPQQLIHWWTSATQTGSANEAAGNTYLVVSGSNVVPISNSGSINHAVTDSSGKFAVRFTNAGGGGDSTVWFNTEVQGIIYSISTTLNNGSA